MTTPSNDERERAIEAQSIAIIEPFSEEGYRAVGHLLNADQLRALYEEQDRLTQSAKALQVSADEAWNRVKVVEAERDRYKAAEMTEKRAREILGMAIINDSLLYGVGESVLWKNKELVAILNGSFLAADLRAIAFWMEKDK